MAKWVLLTFGFTFAAFFVAAGYVLPPWPVNASATTPIAARPHPVSATEVGEHVGQSVTVEGVVSRVYAARSGVTFLDMGGDYPNNPFTGVIFSEDAPSVGNVSGLTGKTVDVTGKVRRYRGKPEIVLRSADQIEVR